MPKNITVVIYVFLRFKEIGLFVCVVLRGNNKAFTFRATKWPAAGMQRHYKIQRMGKSKLLVWN